jgi:hypothetical protein
VTGFQAKRGASGLRDRNTIHDSSSNWAVHPCGRWD